MKRTHHEKLLCANISQIHSSGAKKTAHSQAKLVGAATRTQGVLPKRACLRGQSIPVKLLADSEWTRRDSNPIHRQAIRPVRFDTHRTPSLFQIGGFNLLELAIMQSEIIRQVVVPPILLPSVICLGISPVRLEVAEPLRSDCDRTVALLQQPTCLAPD